MVAVWLALPEVEPESRVEVTVAAAGLSVTDVDQRIAARLGELAGEKMEVEVVSAAGRARAVFEDAAARSDAEALDRVRGLLQDLELPNGAEPPVIASVPPLRAVRWAVHGTDAGARQARLATRVQAMSGVRAVRSCGVADMEIHVLVDPSRASARGVDALRITDVLRGQARDLPDISEMTLREGVRVRDVATVAHRPAATGCRCAGAEGPCATGAAMVESQEAFLDVQRALLTTEETGVVLLEGNVVRVQLRTVPGSSLDQRTDLAREIVERAGRIHRLGHPVVEIDPPEAHDSPRADLTFQATLARDPADAVQLLHDALRRIPGIAVSGATGDSATVFVVGDDFRSLEEIARPLADTLRRTPGVQAVLIDDLDRVPSLRLDVDARRVAELGVAPPTIASAILVATRGDVAAMLVRDGESLPIRVLLEGGPVETTSLDPERLRGFTIPTATGSAALTDLVTFARMDSPVTLRRCGPRRCVRLTVEAAPEQTEALEQARRTAAEQELPPGYALRWTTDPPLFPH